MHSQEVLLWCVGVGGGDPVQRNIPIRLMLHQPRNMIHLQISRSVIKFIPMVQKYSDFP